MSFKIHGRPEADGICAKCRNGQLFQNDRETITLCQTSHPPFRVIRPVTQCTEFEDRAHDSEFEMRRIAWTISTDKKGVLGFRPPVKKSDD